MDNKEVIDLAQVAKEANGLGLHNISSLAVERLKEINLDAGAEIAKRKEAAEKVASEAKAKEIEARAAQAKADEDAAKPEPDAPSAADAAHRPHVARRL